MTSIPFFFKQYQRLTIFYGEYLIEFQHWFSLALVACHLTLHQHCTQCVLIFFFITVMFLKNTILWVFQFIQSWAFKYERWSLSYPGNNTSLSTTHTSLVPTTWEGEHYFKSYLRFCHQSAARFLFFITLVVHASFSMTSPSPSCVEWLSETWGRDIFPVCLMNDYQLSPANSKVALFYRLVARQPRTSLSCIWTQRWWRSLGDVLSSANWAHLPTRRYLIFKATFAITPSVTYKFSRLITDSTHEPILFCPPFIRWTMIRWSTSLLGVKRILKQAAGDLAKMNGRSHMATSLYTPMEYQIFLNCPSNEKVVTGSEVLNRYGFMVVSMHLANFVVGAATFPIQQRN